MSERCRHFQPIFVSSSSSSAPSFSIGSLQAHCDRGAWSRGMDLFRQSAVVRIDVEAGVTAYTFEDAEFKRFLASRCKHVLTVITNDKLSTAAPYSVVPLSRVTRAVIEADADEAEALALIAAGIETTRAS